MLAGASGNLTDRVFRDHVVDFIDIGPWWIFNLADASIVTGLIILGVTVVLLDQGSKPDGQPTTEPLPAAVAANATRSRDDDDG